jgi:hypothetical protein
MAILSQLLYVTNYRTLVFSDWGFLINLTAIAFQHIDFLGRNIQSVEIERLTNV